MLLRGFFICLLSTVGLVTVSNGQYIISNDADGNILTILEYPMTNRSPFRRRFFGNPYLTFPIWQPGTIQLTEQSQEINCRIVYDLVDNEITCQFDETTKSTAVKPHAFTINSVRFISRPKSFLGTVYRTYYAVLAEGETSLLKNYKRILITGKYKIKGQDVEGYYQDKDSYFIRVVATG